jgi:hypothetical protein
VKKTGFYEIAVIIGLLFVILFYVYDYYYLNLNPIVRYGIGLSVLIGFAIAAIFLKAKRGKSLRYSTARNFGEVVSYNDESLSFVRDSTTFCWEMAWSGHQISFQLPETREKFSIRHQAWTLIPADMMMYAKMLSNDRPKKEFAENLFSDCQTFQIPGLPDEFILQSRNTAFLQAVLSSHNVKMTLNKHLSQKFRIVFDGNYFEMNWQTGSNEEVEDFRQICQTAIIFCDELKKLR